MAGGASRRGFTLVELMLTTTIFAVVMAAVSSAFIGGMRLLKATFATAEMSLRARDLRDRLLFHAAPPHNDTIWAGLLSGTNRVSRGWALLSVQFFLYVRISEAIHPGIS